MPVGGGAGRAAAALMNKGPYRGWRDRPQYDWQMAPVSP